MYLQGVSTRKVAAITEGLSRVRIGKDAVSRVAQRLEEEAWRNLLKGLVEGGLHGVRLVISDDHPSICQAVMAELPGASWQRCVVTLCGTF